MMSLTKLIEGKKVYRSDKYDLGYVCEFYDKLFAPLKDARIKILEIGIEYGNSVKLWHDYFTHAEIYAVDPYKTDDAKHVESMDRVSLYFEDAYQFKFLDKLPDNEFDIIIDDGPHTVDSQRFFVKNYPKKLKDNGILVVEDIISVAYTKELSDMLVDFKQVQIVNMAGKCLRPDLKSMWDQGLDVIIAHK